MIRFKLRTLMIVLALGPPIISGLWFAGKFMWLVSNRLPYQVTSFAGSLFLLVAFSAVACVLPFPVAILCKWAADAIERFENHLNDTRR